MQAVNPLVDLIAILAVVLSAGTVLRMLYLLLRGRRPDVLRVLIRLSWCVLAYVAVSLATSAIRPARSIGQEERWCFDDWCVSVDRVTRRPAAGGTIYTLDLQTYNAGSRPQRALYPWVFVRDAGGQQYRSTTKEWETAMAGTIAPHESNHFSLDFLLPPGVRAVGFSTNHGGGAPCRLVPSLLFVSQGGCLFHKYDSIHLQ
jgi:hypothetical protein